MKVIFRESDLFSMELPQYPQYVFSHYLDPIARTIWQLQMLYGQIQTTFGVGKSSKNIHQRFKRICADLGEPLASADQPISHL
jgi:hypothetical protein